MHKLLRVEPQTTNAHGGWVGEGETEYWWLLGIVLETSGWSARFPMLRKIHKAGNLAAVNLNLPYILLRVPWFRFHKCETSQGSSCKRNDKTSRRTITKVITTYCQQQESKAPYIFNNCTGSNYIVKLLFDKINFKI